MISRDFIKLFLILVITVIVISAKAQNIGINATGSTPNTSAGLDVDFTNKGMLVPRVALTGTADVATITTPATSLLVYNTATAGVSPNNVTPGFYYWSGTVWMRLVSSATTSNNDWSTTGNSGTNYSNFIGTTDNVPLKFKINNVFAGKISDTSLVIGVDAFKNNGSRNTVFGTRAMKQPFASNDNVVIGHEAMLLGWVNNSYNVAIGSSALRGGGEANIAIGYQSLYAGNNYGSIAIGNSASYNGARGISFGNSAKESASSNSTGIGIGDLALYNDNNVENIAIGNLTMYNNTTGRNNVAMGTYSLFQNISGKSNVAIGNQSLNNSNGSYNTAIGDSTGFNVLSGTQNTFVGYFANGMSGLTNATAIGANSLVTVSNSLVLGNNANVGIGTSAPTEKLDVIGKTKTDQLQVVTGATNGYILTSDATGNATWQNPSSISGWGLTGNAGTNTATNFIGTTDNVPFNIRVNNQPSGEIDHINFNSFYGYLSGLSNSSGSSNSAFGYQALQSNTTGTGNVAIGTDALASNSTGNSNIAMGYRTLSLNTVGFSNVGIGSEVLNSNRAGRGATAIGFNAMRFANNSLVPFDSYNVAIGYLALAGSFTPAVNTGVSNTAVGAYSMYGNTSGSRNTATGLMAMRTNSGGNDNVANGYASLYYNSTGNNNTAIGNESLFFNDIGSNNSTVGYQSLWSNISGASNSAFGTSALMGNISGSENTAIGHSSLKYNTTGAGNTAIGFQAGQTSTIANANVTGINNTFIGYNSGPGSSTQLVNSAAIGYNAQVTANNSLVLGGTGVDAVNVGIGVTAPSAKLEVAGQVKITGGTPGLGKVLTSDATGLATWQSSSISTWGLLGNAGTVAATNFIGTSDAIDFVTRTNNTERTRITSSGNFGIGDATPSALFTVGNGDLFQVVTTGHTRSINGTAALPTYSFTGDNDNGMYLSNTNELSFSTAGTQRATITSTGNLGIGTATPLAQIHATNEILSAPTTITIPPATGAGNITVAGAASSFNFWSRNITDLSTGTVAGNRWVWYAAGGTARLFTGTTGDVLAITSNGNVGVGTAPAVKFQVGTSGDGTVARANAWNVFSDKRLKKDFSSIDSPLEKVKNMHGYYYYWISGNDTSRQLGYIAQEIETILPELVETDENGIKSVDYAKVTPVLVEAMKEQQTQIEDLKLQYETLLKEVQAMKISMTNSTTEAKK